MIKEKESSRGRNGFTLVELLAVIVILAIILVIAVPKVMSIIEDAKKATLESTAKMIASAAEKTKIQNAVLGNADAITCESVAKLNKGDYASCNITFEENTAKVTIEGKGKFDGLYVCEGTKTSATSINEECTNNSGVAYIRELLEQESNLNNGLIVDDTDDENIRYVGADPNNKIYFNCKDTHNGVTYGSESYDYASACETWRIIGIFDVAKTIGGTPEKRIKIIRDSFIDADGNKLGMSWDSSADGSIEGETAVNYGRGINQWGEVKDSNGNITYEGADLMRILNGYYLGTTNTCNYCNNSNQANCINNCSSSITQLSNNAKDMIENAVWSTRGIEPQKYTAKEIYNVEKTSELTGKSECESNGGCNDGVERTIEWVGKIGLIYVSDWGYASTDINCDDLTILYGGTCSQSNWLHNDLWYWTISPYSDNNESQYVWRLFGSAGASGVAISGAGYVGAVRPVTYLKSDIQIIGGNGKDEPYKLGL